MRYAFPSSIDNDVAESNADRFQICRNPECSRHAYTLIDVVYQYRASIMPYNGKPWMQINGVKYRSPEEFILDYIGIDIPEED